MKVHVWWGRVYPFLFVHEGRREREAEDYSNAVFNGWLFVVGYVVLWIMIDLLMFDTVCRLTTRTVQPSKNECKKTSQTAKLVRLMFNSFYHAHIFNNKTKPYISDSLVDEQVFFKTQMIL